MLYEPKLSWGLGHLVTNELKLCYIVHSISVQCIVVLQEITVQCSVEHTIQVTTNKCDSHRKQADCAVWPEIMFRHLAPGLPLI